MLFKLIIANIKKMLKNPLGIIISTVFPVLIIFIINFFVSGDSETPVDPIRFINHDVKAESVLEEIQKESVIDEEEAMKLLDNGSIKVVAVIPADFTSKLEAGESPVIELISKQEQTPPLMSLMKLQDKVNSKLKQHLLKDQPDFDTSILDAKGFNIKQEAVQGISSVKDLMSFLMILYMTSIMSGTFSKELLDMRNTGSLERLLTTKTNQKSIVGSIFLSFMFIYSIANVLGIFVLNYLVNVQLPNIPLLVLYVVLMNVTNFGVALIGARYVPNEKAVTLPNMIFSMFGFFAYLIYFKSNMTGTVSPALKIINQLNPYYWAVEGMISGVIWPNALILLLFIGVFFTLGSLSMRSYVRAQH